MEIRAYAPWSTGGFWPAILVLLLGALVVDAGAVDTGPVATGAAAAWAKPRPSSTRLPGTGISYWKLRRGEIHATFRFERQTTEHGQSLLTARATGRKGGKAVLRLLGRKEDLSWITLDIDLPEPGLFGRKLAAYLDPPTRRSRATALGGTHARSVVVQQPRPYAFRNRRDESASGRMINRNVMLMAELARVALVDVTPSRSRVKRSSGMVVHDPYLDWLVGRFVAAIVDQREELRLGKRRIVVRVDPASATARLAIRAPGVEDVLAPADRDRMAAAPAAVGNGGGGNRGSIASLARRIRQARDRD